MDDETKKQLHEDRLMSELCNVIMYGPLSADNTLLSATAAAELVARGWVIRTHDDGYCAMAECSIPLAAHIARQRDQLLALQTAPRSNAAADNKRISELWQGMIEAKERHIVATDLMTYAVEQLCEAARIDFGLCDDYSLPEKVLVIARRIVSDSLNKDEE